MLVLSRKESESIVIKLDDGEQIEFTEEDLASIGTDADEAVEMIKNGLFEE